MGLRTGPARAALAFFSLALGWFAVTILLSTLDALQRQAQPDGGVYGYVVPTSARGDGLADDMAQALSDRLTYEANAKVMKAGNGLLGTLFDAFA